MKNLQIKIAALLFGICIWFYAISLHDFELTLDAPLVFLRIPDELAIASKPPQSISIRVSGNLLDLIRMRSSGMRAATITVDAARAEQGWAHFPITAENFSSPDFPNVQYIEGERARSVEVEFDTKIHKNVPVRLAAEFTPAKGYTFISAPSIKPSEIVFQGARAVITPLKSIQTKSNLFKNITQNASFKIALDLDSLPNHILVDDSIVTVSVEVQPLASRTFEKIPVHLIGVFDKTRFKLTPEFATVEITGGSQVLKEVSPEEIDIFIEFNRFAIESEDALAPTIRLSKNVKDIQVRPETFKLEEIKKKSEPEKEKDEAELPKENSEIENVSL